MTDFVQLSREERALFNPAFTGLVTARAVQGYEERYGQPCPVVVAVLSAVVALQPAIRQLLPKNTSKGLISWLEEHRAVAVLMSENATALADVVRPGLLLAMQLQTLRVDEEGRLSVVPRAIPRTPAGTAESKAIQKASHMLGRWLPSSGGLSTVLTLLGVRP